MIRYFLLFLLSISSLSAESRLFDVFLFSNELDILELRLLEHGDAVDYFVLVEGTKTFTGKPKPLCFEKHKERFKRWKDKIIYLIISDFPKKIKSDIWKREYYKKGKVWQREYYTRDYALSMLDTICHPDDLILHSDCDEIVSADVLMDFKNSCNHFPHCLQADFYYYNCNWKKRFKWDRIFIAKYEDVKRKGLLGMRMDAGSLPKILDSAWHLSYFMTSEEIADKIKSFSHTEYNQPPFTDLNHIQDAINLGKDLFGRNGEEDCVRASRDDKLPKYIYILPAIFQRN